MLPDRLVNKGIGAQEMMSHEKISEMGHFLEVIS
jgi:hypothetical protein